MSICLDVLPTPTVANERNQSGGHAIGNSKGFARLHTFADCQHVSRGEPGVSVLLPLWGGPMRNSIPLVLFAGSPAQVGGMVVESITVQMAALHPARARPACDFEDKPVNQHRLSFVVADDTDFWVTVAVKMRAHWPPDFGEHPMRPACAASNHPPTRVRPTVGSDAEPCENRVFLDGGNVMQHDRPFSAGRVRPPHRHEPSRGSLHCRRTRWEVSNP